MTFIKRSTCCDRVKNSDEFANILFAFPSPSHILLELCLSTQPFTHHSGYHPSFP